MENLKKSFKDLKWYEWVMILVMIIIAGKVMVEAFINPGESPLPAWLTVVNFISAICGIICIFFCAKASISSYIFGIINTVVYIIYLHNQKIYGTMYLELLLYLPANIIGWIMWARHRDVIEKEKTKSKKLDLIENMLCTAIVIVSAFAYHRILVNMGGEVAWLDAFTVSIGYVAMFLQLFRYREQYFWWLVTDFVAVAMYIVHFDPVYLTKKSIYLIMAFVGLYNWWKLQKERNVENE